MFLYEHTQKALLIVAVLAATVIIGITACIAIILAKNPVGTLIIVCFAACIVPAGLMAVFYSLTVQLHPDYLKFYFGPGLFGKKIPLANIASCTAVKNSWQHGWGIHKIPNGWVYNIAGFDAIEITLKTGKKLRIGTDQPNELTNAVNSALLSTTQN